MIISASYKTDIPAFYGEWFMNRLRAGFCKMINPYNRQAVRVSLQPDDVDGIVFWTKNVGPFLRHLPEVAAAGFPFLIQYTINSYPRTLEYSVTDARRSVANVCKLADAYGSKVCVWRYDTILSTSLTPFDFHRENFEWLARALSGAVDEVVISFAHFYRKTLRNMEWAGQEFGFTWDDPAEEEKCHLVTDLVEAARAHGIRLTVCSQPQYAVAGAGEAKCVDAERFEAITGRRVVAKVKGNRKECGCFESRDIGEYDTCPHGCVYCYAVQNRELAQRRFRTHDPSGEFLFGTAGAGGGGDSPATIQLPLFGG